jgi:glutamyl-tRNA reductase
MSGYKNFAIIGAGELGMYVVRQFLEEKAAGTIDEVVVLTRQVSPVRPLAVFFFQRFRHIQRTDCPR